MGNISLSCVSCIERDQEAQVKATDLQELEDTTKKHQEPTVPSISADELKACEQSKAPSASHDDELKARINAIIKARQGSDQVRAARADQCKQPASALSIDTKLKAALADCGKQPTAALTVDRRSSLIVDTDLQARMNAIVNARKQSQVACSSSGGELQALVVELQAPSSTLNANAEPFQQSPVACSEDSGLQDQINMIVGAHARSLKQQRLSLDLSSPSPSPSPAKSVSDMEFGYFANFALSQAKERNTPATSPPSLQHIHWTTYEDEIAPRNLSFAGCGGMGEPQQDVASKIVEEIDSTASCIAQPQDKCADAQTCAFNLSEIPSPTRARAKKQRSLWADVEVQEDAVEEVQAKVPAAGPEQTAAGEEISGATKAMQAKVLRQLAEKEEMAAMSKVCVETFLESVKKCAWRERVKTPIKGSNLYTKHIRPCRPAGTSVDVKDSSFRNLGSFLQFLEAEYLLRLKPGLSDPMVSEIYFDACRKYKYNAQQQEWFMTAASGAPHEAGCSCRLCLPCTASATWQ